MRLARYDHDGEVGVGSVDEASGTVHRVLDSAGRPVRDLAAAIADDVDSGLRGLRIGDADPVALDQVRLLAPLRTSGRNVMCVGKNYRAHSEEFARSGFDSSDSSGAAALPEHPIVFTKADNTIIGPGDPVDPHLDLTQALDYEAEVAVVIGRPGKRITRDSAWDHVWGYTLLNDITARDIQQRHKQWFLGKSLDTFCPLGPWLVTADEIGTSPIELECFVNGELRQKATTRDLIFDIPELVATISRGMTLRPGDIIATGTPEGVGIGFDPPRFLQPGDTVTVVSGQLGRLETPVAVDVVSAADSAMVTS